MMQLVFMYRKSLVKTKAPGVVKVGNSEINCSSFHVEDHAIDVQYNPESKNRHGTTMPMIIEIHSGGEDPGLLDNVPVDHMEMKKSQKAEKERERYRRLNPNQKRFRKL